MTETSLPNFIPHDSILHQFVDEAKRWMPPMTLNGHAVSLELLIYGSNRPHNTYGAHLHPVYEAHVCLSGHARYQLAGTAFDIEPGMVLLHAPQVPHAWTTDDDPWTILVAWFYIDPPPAVPIPTRWPVWPDVLHEMVLLLADYEERLTGWQDRAIARLTAIASRILCLAEMNPITPRQLTPDDLRFEQIRAYLQQHLALPLQVADIARAACMSIRSLHRWFTRHTGQSLMRFLLDLRMQQAAQLLMRTSQPLAHIAEAVGIPEASYFNRRFRTYFHATPLQYRQQYRPHFLDEQAGT
jgi:AraC-like DNA-binding protein